MNLRQLRAQCLERNIYEVDLTTAWPWQDVLRAQAPATRREIVGLGVTKFAFLLRGVRDANYAGPRHVFEVTRVDGTLCHLPFHKNGAMDATKVITAQTGDVQPLAMTLGYGRPGEGIGKKEAHMACTRILATRHNVRDTCDAIDVTNEICFEWSRFLSNQHLDHKVIGHGIERVFVCRMDSTALPALAFCRSDNQCYIVTPSRMSGNPPYTTLDSWQTCPLFMNAGTTTEPWMRMTASAS